MNPDAFNMSIRKFLKMAGVQSQREIETAVERAMVAGKLKGNEALQAQMSLTIDGVALNVSFDGKIALEGEWGARGGPRRGRRIVSRAGHVRRRRRRRR